jgi:hypothetical protein
VNVLTLMLSHLQHSHWTLDLSSIPPVMNGDRDFYCKLYGHFLCKWFCKINVQFFERGRNVMIIAYNHNSSTRNPRSDETNIFRRQSPTRIRTVQTYIVQLPFLTTLRCLWLLLPLNFMSLNFRRLFTRVLLYYY